MGNSNTSPPPPSLSPFPDTSKQTPQVVYAFSLSFFLSPPSPSTDEGGRTQSRKNDGTPSFLLSLPGSERPPEGN